MERKGNKKKRIFLHCFTIVNCINYHIEDILGTYSKIKKKWEPLLLKSSSYLPRKNREIPSKVFGVPYNTLNVTVTNEKQKRNEGFLLEQFCEYNFQILPYRTFLTLPCFTFTLLWFPSFTIQTSHNLFQSRIEKEKQSLQNCMCMYVHIHVTY